MMIPFRVNRPVFAVGAVLVVAGMGIIGLAKEQQRAFPAKLRAYTWENHPDGGFEFPSRDIYLVGIAFATCGTGLVVSSVSDARRECKP